MKTAKPFRHFDLLVKLPALLVLSVLTLCQALSPALLQAKDPPAKTPSGVSSKASAKAKSKPKTQANVKAPADSLPWPQNILALAGNGAVLVKDSHAAPGQPQELYAHNAEKYYVPASILKIVTSGAALEFLGPDFRFKTDFLLTRNHDLWIVGYGDPYLVSEELALIVKELQKLGLNDINNIYIDDSYFEKGLVLDGNTQTRSPFDAYNVAFSANYNTVSFQKDKKGRISRAAAHIPLTPLALKLAAETKGTGTFTLNISENPEAAELNSGELFKAHLKEAGLSVRGEIFTGRTAPARRKVFYRHESSIPLEVAVKYLMEYSNNFMSNQIFLALGAELYGPPATLAKSQAAMNVFFQRHALDPIVMGDGSGLSRRTTLTARQMTDVLQVVEPDRYLFTPSRDGRVLAKTGTMSDIKTLAGYLERSGEPDRPLSFVILLNGPGYTGTRDRILDLLKARFLDDPPGAGGR
ncbi:MAG: D-alanyl-D-alanine carboxypeptidase [Candidatus Adiutrix sp.]|jgi:D-alanyl-D-alanine carboxypeptidase/D-alanyl-D-alanine-endopeptidase (penicillin-binding protein 4)|nr:D-alanyl-D-alanine carboxypeptidase [Candidatus Adiutrix sp.]